LQNYSIVLKIISNDINFFYCYRSLFNFFKYFLPITTTIINNVTCFEGGGNPGSYFNMKAFMIFYVFGLRIIVTLQCTIVFLQLPTTRLYICQCGLLFIRHFLVLTFLQPIGYNLFIIIKGLNIVSKILSPDDSLDFDFLFNGLSNWFYQCWSTLQFMHRIFFWEFLLAEIFLIFLETFFIGETIW